MAPLAAGGTVQFILDGGAMRGPVGLDATGWATFVSNTLDVGTHTVLAVYAGNVNYLPSTSATLNQTVDKATTRTVVTSSGTPR